MPRAGNDRGGMRKSAAEAMVQRVLARAGLDSAQTSTRTKTGWCLREGLIHLSLQDERLAQRIEMHGVPTFYDCCATPQAPGRACRHEATQDLKDPATCFESLCRIIVGQFVSGKSAQAAWRRLLSLRGPHDPVLTPAMILAHYQQQQVQPSLLPPSQSTSTLPASGNGSNSTDDFATALGLTKNKAKALYDLALHFSDGRLSEDFLQARTGHNANNKNHHVGGGGGSGHDTPQQVTAIRQALLGVRGIGEWSCDMFLLFTLEHSNVLPLGDLGVRKGIVKHFFPQFKALDARRDGPKIHARLASFRPYHSLLSYYMWRVADSPEDVIVDVDDSSNKAKCVLALDITAEIRSLPMVEKTSSSENDNIVSPEVSTPPKKRARRSPRHTVTP